MADIIIKKAETRREHAQCVQIRTLVFVVGQNVPAAREIDQDEDHCTYLLATIDGVPSGTVRWRKAADNLAKIERLAVLESARGQGLAKRLTQAVMDDIETDLSVQMIKLGAQEYIIPLYKSFGFYVIGDRYLDGGTIPHFDMVKQLRL